MEYNVPKLRGYLGNNNLISHYKIERILKEYGKMYEIRESLVYPFDIIREYSLCPQNVEKETSPRS